MAASYIVSATLKGDHAFAVIRLPNSQDDQSADIAEAAVALRAAAASGGRLAIQGAEVTVEVATMYDVRVLKVILPLVAA